MIYFFRDIFSCAIFSSTFFLCWPLLSCTCLLMFCFVEPRWAEPGSDPSRAPSPEPSPESRAGLGFQAEPSPGPGPIPSTKPSQVTRDGPWDKPSRIPSPEPRANPQVSPELSPELSLSQAPSWAEPIELIPESQAEPEPKAEMSRGPNSELNWAALSRSLSCDKPSLELSALSKPRRVPSLGLQSVGPWCGAAQIVPVWCETGKVEWSVTAKLEFGKYICLEVRSWW